jgi:predicted transcriptional regulator
MSKTLVEMAAEIVTAQCSATGMNTEEVNAALAETFNVLRKLQQAETAEDGGDAAVAGKPAVAPEKSILKNKIICLECGQEFRMLSPKHLRSHGLTGRDYRAKWGFKARQPLCAKSLSERRKKAGKARGLPENLRKSIEKRRKAGAAKKSGK